MAPDSVPSIGPSVKGTAFDSVLQDARTLVGSGRITPEQLETQLEAEDVAYLDEKINPMSWYSVQTYTRWIELLAEVEGNDRPEAYYNRRGSIAADRLHDSGLYPMLETKSERLGLRALRVFITIAEALYNFMKWRGEVNEDGKGFTIFVDEALDYPNPARFVAEGFLAHGAERVIGQPVSVWSERPVDDQVVFHFSVGEEHQR